MKTKILILASNPKGTIFLELQREIRDLMEVIKRSPDRDRFTIEDRLAVRPQDLQSALLEVKPRIVHFCGHGEGEGGIVLQNDSGQPHLVSTEALADLFRHFSNQIECVLLNVIVHSPLLKKQNSKPNNSHSSNLMYAMNHGWTEQR